ncbi:MAG: hypothetical protein ACFFED_09865 [Candidatus Thorarchaeota archaeon]
MERKQNAGMIAFLGVVLFLFSFLFVLQIPEFYLLSLILMFIGVIMIGIGGAILKGFDKSLDEPEEGCYYCKGTGTSDDGGTCPRCGGTGIDNIDDE